MLSSDKNIESIVQLIEALKEYAELKKVYIKFDLAAKVVKLFTALALAILLLTLSVAVLFYASFAAVYWMAPAIGTASAFAIVALVFLAALAATVAFRKQWIERPLTKLMAGILLED